jgi:hypothetical protein
MIGSAMGQFSYRFQVFRRRTAGRGATSLINNRKIRIDFSYEVSGASKNRILSTDWVAAEGQNK